MIVETLETQNQAKLVQWRDVTGMHRAIVPSTKVSANGEIAIEELERGIPYGVPWENLAIVTVTPHVIARLLRDRGIWTEDDLQRNLPNVRAAFNDAWSADLKNLIDSVRQAREGSDS